MTAVAQRHIQMAAKLYDIRDTVKRHLGENYAGRMAEYSAVIKEVALKRGTSELDAATLMSRDPALSPFTALTVMAAAVELVEPSA